MPTLQPWQRENILAAASFLRQGFGGNPPTEPRAKVVHDGLLEVLDPSRRAVRLQREMNAAARAVAAQARAERRAADRRAADRRKANLGSPAGSPERRGGERRAGSDRRAKK